MKHAIKNGGRDRDIPVKDIRPVFEGFVGCDQGGSPLVALAEDLKEKVGPELIDGEISQLIDQQDFRACITFQTGLEPVCSLCSDQGVDDVDRRGIEHRVILLAGLASQGGGQMGFTDADPAYEHHIPFVLEEAQPEQILDLWPVDFPWPVPVELIQCFQDRETGLLDVPGHPVAMESVPLALHEALKELVVSPLLSGRFGSQVLMVFAAPGQAQIGKQFGKFHFSPPS